MEKTSLFSCLLLLIICQQITQGEEQQSQGFDCFNIWTKNKHAASGVYTIKPLGAKDAFKVFCEMKQNGGWTLIQKHNGENGLLFNKTWLEYENGFGNLEGEHWLGLRNIHALTQQTNRPSKLHISIGDFNNNEAYAEYSSFSIGNAKVHYRLSAKNYSGTAGDALLGDAKVHGTNQHGNFFSTLDKPNDQCYPKCRSRDIMYLSCSNHYESGWWFNACGLANLNGIWRQPPRHKYRTSFISWPTWRPYESLKFSKMYLIHN